MRRTAMICTAMFILAISGFSLQVGMMFNGDLQGATPSTYLGVTVRSVYGLVGLELGVMPQILPNFDFTTYRFIVSPSIGWGTPELRIFGAIAPHIMLKEGKFDFNLAQWNIGAGASFMFAKNIIGFFEFFLGFDFMNGGSIGELTTGSFISVGVTYNFDVGF